MYIYIKVFLLLDKGLKKSIKKNGDIGKYKLNEMEALNMK